MAEATVTSKRQVTIPKEVRDRFGFEPGDRLEFIEENGVLQVRKKIDESVFRRWRGYLAHKGLSTDEFIEELRGR